MAQNPEVLISGAGIAGPTLAYWMLRHGFRPTLIERSPGLRSGGYIVDFWGLGYDVAERMDLLPAIRGVAYDVDEVRFVDESGHRVGGFRADVIRQMAKGRFVSLRRSDLSRLIFDKIDDRCEIIFGDSITAIHHQDNSARVEFEQGLAREFDFIVGADGLHSIVRELAFGPQKNFERHLGYAVAAFDAEDYHPRDERAYVSYTVPGKQVARFAMRDNRTMFFFIFKTRHGHSFDLRDISVQKRILRQEFGEIGWECKNILAALDVTTDLYFDRVSQIRLDHWSRGRVALVGDAAFCPSLLAGQGSALAMAGAYVLAGEISRFKADPVTAFQRYESALWPFIRRKQDAATRFATSFAPNTQLGLFVRNQMTKLFQIPGVARFFVARQLMDQMALPDYEPS